MCKILMILGTPTWKTENSITLVFSEMGYGLMEPKMASKLRRSSNSDVASFKF